MGTSRSSVNGRTLVSCRTNHSTQFVRYSNNEFISAVIAAVLDCRTLSTCKHTARHTRAPNWVPIRIIVCQQTIHTFTTHINLLYYTPNQGNHRLYDFISCLYYLKQRIFVGIPLSGIYTGYILWGCPSTFAVYSPTLMLFCISRVTLMSFVC